MNPLCPNCKIMMNKDRNEFYCSKCGLVIDTQELIPDYDKECRSFVPAWRANQSQTMPAEMWVKNRCIIRGMKQQH